MSEMENAVRLALLSPLTPPRPDRDGKLYDVFADRRRKVGSYRVAPVTWPCAGRRGYQLIVTDELALAVERESEIALAYHLAVEVHTIQRWRRRLGVGRINEGTARLYQEYAPEKVAGETAQALAQLPEVRGPAAKKSGQSRRGKSKFMSDDGWTSEEDTVASRLTPSKAKLLLPHRSLAAIRMRRHHLRHPRGGD